ncbi:MAG: GHMP kinase [Candidatus Latescibacteria bacterium]|jgi:D-glycero-alpha-D-manno-heptose-7-phosphate kinase|nr:GHMP kinase [Candidatus Latescibacterota bacterium]
MNTPKPIRTINSVAPIRICDNGGWTDTWFAEHGKIFNIGVYPYAEVQIDVFNRADCESRIVLHAENFGERYVVHPENIGWDRHPLLEAAIEHMGVPEHFAIQATIYSEAPAGGSTGTSAAVTVALIGALDQLTPGRLTPHEIAYAAQSVETDMLHQQCGIQDQLCSAYGGINYIDMFSYPHASVSQLHIPNTTWWELERRLILIYLGKSHSSSNVHERVIRELEGAGPDNPKLEALRATAEKSRDAVFASDFAALGKAMSDNTSAQANLNPYLISTDAQRIIDIAQSHGAIGWKVNGAGGEGGSLTLLCDEHSSAKRALIGEVESDNKLFKNIPVYLSRFGLRIWET